MQPARTARFYKAPDRPLSKYTYMMEKRCLTLFGNFIHDGDFSWQMDKIRRHSSSYCDQLSSLNIDDKDARDVWYYLFDRNMPLKCQYKPPASLKYDPSVCRFKATRAAFITWCARPTPALLKKVIGQLPPKSGAFVDQSLESETSSSSASSSGDETEDEEESAAEGGRDDTDVTTGPNSTVRSYRQPLAQMLGFTRPSTGNHSDAHKTDDPATFPPSSPPSSIDRRGPGDTNILRARRYAEMRQSAFQDAEWAVGALRRVRSCATLNYFDLCARLEDSGAWLYQWKCRCCGDIFVYRCGLTGNLVTHLHHCPRRRHPPPDLLPWTKLRPARKPWSKKTITKQIRGA
ncbi:hypothetical protein CF319_g8626 [Tilletia indica]|nr:hypothetical protein CF319_g8626 [Tilletia indica]